MPGKKIIQELPDKLFHIESTYYNSLKVGDIINVSGNDLGGHGEKLVNNINSATYLTEDEKVLLSNFIKEELDFTRLEFDTFYSCKKKRNLSELDRSIFESVRIEIMYEIIRREIDTNLLSRFNCIFLCKKKYIEPWYKVLNKHRNPIIYELSAISTNSFLIRDEYHCQDYSTSWFQSEKYWSELSALNLTLYEILFTGKLEVTQIHDSVDSVKQANPLGNNIKNN